MSKLKKRVNILDLSDIHLGHKNTPTDFIIDNLYKFFDDYSKLLEDVDIIIISGDMFDRLLPTNSQDYLSIIEWITNLSKYCQKRNIKLRYLEGTPSHDFKQLSAFNTILKKLEIKIDFKYFEKITIEYIHEYNMHILYIPDEANETANETYIEVLALLKEHNLHKVDLIVMHGQFHYHLPMFNSPISHTEENYLQLTDNYILCGHIHTHSRYDRILTIGSFDRNKHNEEEDKGAIYLTLNDGVNEYIFLKNKHSKTYKTFHYTDETIETIIHVIRKMQFKDGSFIRIRINKGSDLKNSLDVLKNLFKHIHIKIEYNDEEDKEKKIEIHVSEEFSITKNNIVSLVKEHIFDKDTLDELNKFI